MTTLTLGDLLLSQRRTENRAAKSIHSPPIQFGYNEEDRLDFRIDGFRRRHFLFLDFPRLSIVDSSTTDSDTIIPLSGSFSSYISGWAPSSSPQSRTWYDATTGTTSIRLSGCSTNGPQGFRNVTLRLTRTTGVNAHIGSRSNSCTSSSWSVASNRTGNHRFGSTHINGVTSYNGTWSANSVVVSY